VPPVVNLAVGVWALLTALRGGTAGGALTGGVVAGLALLVAQSLAHLDLLGRCTAVRSTP
jgi:hypothetical protein